MASTGSGSGEKSTDGTMDLKNQQYSGLPTPLHPMLVRGVHQILLYPWALSWLQYSMAPKLAVSARQQFCIQQQAKYYKFIRSINICREVYLHFCMLHDKLAQNLQHLTHRTRASDKRC